jgi:hypothetical protein
MYYLIVNIHKIQKSIELIELSRSSIFLIVVQSLTGITVTLPPFVFSPF